jgi:hypothetical protein
MFVSTFDKKYQGLEIMQVVPEAIERRAEKYRLGQMQGVYAFRRQVPLGYVLGPLSMVIGCLILALFVLLYVDAWPQLTNAVGALDLLNVADWQNWQVVLLLFVGIAWLLVGVWMIVAARLVRNMRVYVYEYGLISLRVQAMVVMWQDVVSLWKDVRVNGRSGNGKKQEKRVFTLQCADDRLVRFDDELVDIEKLGTMLEDTVTRRLLPGVIATYEAGSVVVFADVAVSLRGVAIRRARQLLPWQDVAGVTIDDHTLTLYHFHKDGVWASLSVASIPNIGVLKALLEYAMRDLSHLRLPGVLATYDAGLALDFGALRVSQSGVEVVQGNGSGGVRLPWDEVASVAVGEHEVLMRRRGARSDWYTVPLSAVYDAPLLKALLEHLMRKG